MEIKELLRSLIDGNKSDFSQNLEQILTDRAKIAIADKKIDVAADMFSEAESPYMDYDEIDPEEEEMDHEDKPKVRRPGQEAEPFGDEPEIDGLGGSSQDFIDAHGEAELVDLLPEGVIEDVMEVLESGEEAEIELQDGSTLTVDPKLAKKIAEKVDQMSAQEQDKFERKASISKTAFAMAVNESLFG